MNKISSETKRRIKLVVQGGLLATYHYTKSYITYLTIRKELKRNRAFHNIAVDKIVFIVGNGPSLNETNWVAIKCHDFIVMNNYCKTRDQSDMNIVAHCYGEPSHSISWEARQIEKVIDEQLAKSYWLHSSSLKYFTEHKNKDKIHYFHAGCEPALSLSRAISLDKIAISYETTAQMAIQLALFMGYKRIGLLGMDHDWPFSGSYLKHYYSLERDNNDHLGRESMMSLLTKYKHMWELYLALAASAEKHKAKIYNLNYKSKLDVFRKLTLEEFLL